jgi:flagellar basal-body rod protein FlgF
VNGPNGALYTRNGNFHFNTQGALVTAEGYSVRLTGGKTLQTSSISPIQVGRDGQVSQDGNTLGQLEVANFSEPSSLNKIASTYFATADPKDGPDLPSNAEVLQSTTEASNSAPAESAARMVTLLRHFEMLQHAIKIGTEMNKQSVEEVARVTP